MPDPGRNEPRRQGPHHPLHGRGGSRGDDRPPFPFTDDDARCILNRDGRAMVSKASELASHLSQVKAAQVRNFYGSLLRIEARLEAMAPQEIATELQLLRPKLAYMASREQAARRLKEVFDRLIEAAASQCASAEPEQARKTARCVFEFAEAVIAYHREGRSS